MSKTEEHYKKIEGDCSTVIDSCAKEAEICKHKEKNANYQKEVAMCLGGASVVTIGGGTF